MSVADPVVETIQEYATSAGRSLRVDRINNIVHGVKVVGLESKNQRGYPAPMLESRVGLYDGAEVYVNHGLPGQARRYEDRNGRLVNARFEKDGIYADHAYNPKHAVTEQYLWDAENCPSNVGFSHSAQAKLTRKDGKVIVEDIIKVNSVDLVARPATTRGLFEGEGDIPEEQREFCEHGFSAISDARLILLSENPVDVKQTKLQELLETWRDDLSGTSKGKEKSMEWKDITLEGIKEHRQDLVAVISGTDETSRLTAEVKALTESVTAKDAALAEATAKLTAAETEKVLAVKRTAIVEELTKAGVKADDESSCPKIVMEQLLAATDAEARKPLVELLARAAKTVPVHEAMDSPPLGSASAGTKRDEAHGVSRWR